MKTRLAILTILTAWLAPTASAQDEKRFKVHVPPFMQLVAVSADGLKTHPMTGSDVTFSNQRWRARTSSATGSTIRFSTDHAFRNLTSPAYKRDVRLRLTRIVGTGRAGWAFDTITDTTDYANGDEIATVQVSGNGPGTASFFMDITFITGNLSTLAEGQYQLTVVGTITEN